MATREIRADVCVVGAGPAGLVLALLLIRSGRSVVVLERNRSLGREFRGEILQPGALALLDRLGVLAGARARGAHEHARFQLVERERVLLDIDYGSLPAPHDHLLSLPQSHVLAELAEQCEKYDGFQLLKGHRAGALVHEDGRVAGVTGDGPSGPFVVRSRVVVGADGRFSKVRGLAGIDAGRSDVFDQDVLWFKLDGGAREPGASRAVQVYRADGRPVLVYDSWPDRVQIGWTLPHKGYRKVAARGLPAIKEELARAVPRYADLIHEQVTSTRDLTLLDVFSGRAERWADDGLVLIGDAAHTHSPIGAQGINLAVQDAVVLHPVLIDALDRGDTSRSALSAFEERRAPDIATVMRIQSVQSGLMLSTGFFATRARPRLAALMRRTPLFRLVLHRIAYGNPDIRIAEECFS
ncbi:FAD-dependent monooxygenase [Streptomyces sp. NPDC048417]|uniref:FAD-dependent monooxygenase n=1 Tax=Streptomyces sp. NPDC048417 TaxID=3155387 RepID=UPI003444DCC4